MSPLLRRTAACLAAAALAACSPSSPETPTGAKLPSSPPPSPSGDNLLVTVTTSGNSSDPTGYSVMIDGDVRTGIAGDGQVMLAGLAPGPHTVALGDLAPGCSVSGSEPRSLVLPDSQPYAFDEVDFAVLCMDAAALAPGTISVYTSVLHATEPYEMVFTLSDGQKLDLPSLAMGSGIRGSFAGLADTTYTVSGRAPLGNRFIMYCHWITPSQASATLVAGSGAAVLFVIGCGDS